MHPWPPPLIVAAILALVPLFAAGLCPACLQAARPGASRSSLIARLLTPALLVTPYVLVAHARGTFAWSWFALYAALPVAIAGVLWWAAQTDPEQHGTNADCAVLLLLGLAVDLRWFEPAWPHGLTAFNKILLLDAGIYGFLGIRRLEGVGYDLRLRGRDLLIGLRELALYTPIAIPIGVALHFLHFHAQWPTLTRSVGAWVFTFLLIAIPEELFFRGWLQNLLERRLGARKALLATACIFGLAHFNKRTMFVNWRYVLLAAIAGIFYGRAWRADRRVAASAITHASVDTLWSLFLR